MKLNYLVFFLIALLVVCSVLGSADLSSIEKHFFNSDTLYLPSIYQDFIIDENSFLDFNFNPAPNFFPDMGLHLILMKFVGGNFIWAAFIFAVLQLFSVFVLLNKVGELFHLKNENTTYLGLIFLLLFYLPAIVSNDFLFTFYFLINSYHLGSFILTLLLVILIIKALNKSSFLLYTVILFLIILGYVSDKSLIMNFSLPTLGALISYKLLNKKVDYNHFWSVFFIIVAGNFLGWFVLLLNTNYEWLIIAKTDLTFNFEASRRSFAFFYMETLNYLGEFSFVSLIILISILSYCCYIVVLVKEFKKGVLFLDLQLFLMVTFILFSPVLIGKITGPDSIRYNYHGIILLVFIFPFLINRLFPFSSSKYFKKIAIILFLVLGLLFTLKISFIGITNYFNIYPKEVSSLDNVKDELGLKNGLGTYWKAKKTTLFSRRDLKVYCVHEDLKVYRHVTNNTWYYDDVKNKGNRPVYNFFICENENMTTAILKRFPNAKIIKLHESLSILKTKDFTFNEEYQIVEL